MKSLKGFLTILILSVLQSVVQGSSVNVNPIKLEKMLQDITDSLNTDKSRTQVSLNRTLVAMLDTILSDDQTCRGKLHSIEEKFGAASVEYSALIDTIVYKDEINLSKVQSILDRYGWLGKEEIGERGPLTLFLVIQHAPLPVQLKYLPVMKAAVKVGNASTQNYAYLEDRVALAQGKRQVYGSQIARSKETGMYYVLPLEDPINVDKRRAEVGLPLLKDYLNQFGVDWNVDLFVEHRPEKTQIVAPSILMYKKRERTIPFNNRTSTN
ncbi:DUF6624 domain-containing protein [Arcticibacter eurypsychrophilus]|uniref:DUF6624 domain-containing protein n=1 Tax=Arcticibacter eurypsychrophilus TaxID=1434752 RepID=UPI00084D2385|nr:DUF6624 domain-containing protein [Arcticibacter eurypsychrophilus]